MNKKWAIIVLCAIALVIGTLPFVMRAQTSQSIVRKSAPGPEPAVPEYVIYGALFHHVVDVQQQAGEAEGRGEDASSLRLKFQRKADLTQTQALLLNIIESDCVREVAGQDAKAKVVIDAFKAQHPSGKIKAGEKLPPPPSELIPMQEERNAIILRARDRLRVAFGDEAFERFNHFVATRVASGIRPVSFHARPEERSASQLQSRP